MTEVTTGVPPGLTGGGLLLRAPVLADRPRMLALAHDPDQLAHGIPVGVPLPGSLEDLDERVAKAAAAYGRREPGDMVVAAVDDPTVFLGSISWRFDVPPVLGVVDVGYTVHPDARGRGVAGTALRLLAGWLLHDADGPRLPRVQLDHSTENPASCRVALAAGLGREGVRRGFLPLRGPADGPGERRHDVCLHGLLQDDPIPPLRT